MLSRTRRVRRTSLTAILGVGALALVGPGQALAGPTHTVTAGPTSLSGQSGNLVASLADNSIRTTGAVGPGHRAGLRYCSPWANSTVTTLSTRTSRWHLNPHVGYMRVLGASGEAGRIVDAHQGIQSAVIARDWSVGSACATLEFYASGSSSHSGIWTAQIVGATIEDNQGPSVGGVSAPQGWVTDDSAPITFSTSDNGLGQGAVTVGVGATTRHAGDLPVGQRTVTSGFGPLPDGQHIVTVTRAGHGWAPQSQATHIRIDRNAPETPRAVAATNAWSKNPVAVTADATNDGTGSGWKENQFSIDGSPWMAGAGTTVSASGIHTVSSRAIDHAGNVSGTSTATVKIDRVAPGGSLSGIRRVAKGTVIANVSAQDTLSGVRNWKVVLGSRTLASGTAAGRQIVITGLTGRQRLRLVVEDVAGNVATVANRDVDFGAKSAPTALAPKPAPTAPLIPPTLGPAPRWSQVGIPRKGLAGARIAKGTPIPFWVRKIQGIGTRRAYALDGSGVRLTLRRIGTRARVGKRLVPLVRVTGTAKRRVVTGRFTTTSGAPLPYPHVIVRNPNGEIVQTRRGGKRGIFRFRVDRRLDGNWTVELWGRPSRRFTVLVRPGARVSTSLRKMTIPSRSRLSISGRVTPGRAARGRIVQLQWLDETAGVRNWRPIVNTRVSATGRFRLRYLFRRAGGYSVKMRVVALGSPGTPTLRTPPRTVTVLP